jgi:hypothetical protein
MEDLDFVTRLQNEAEELDEHYTKLVAFFGTDTYTKLSSAHKALLDQQEKLMKGLYDVLTIRLALLRAEMS